MRNGAFFSSSIMSRRVGASMAPKALRAFHIVVAPRLYLLKTFR